MCYIVNEDDTCSTVVLVGVQHWMSEDTPQVSNTVAQVQGTLITNMQETEIYTKTTTPHQIKWTVQIYTTETMQAHEQ